MKSIELLSSLIYLIFVIFRHLYDCCKFITSIINCFFYVVLNFTKQLYSDLKSMQKMKKIFDCKMFVNVILTMISMSNSWIIAYNFAINTLRIIRLHLTNNQYKKLILLIESIKHITNPVCEKKILLLTNDEFVKITNCKMFLFNFTNFEFFDLLLIYYCKRLLKVIISSSLISMVWTTWKKSKNVSN